MKRDPKQLVSGVQLTTSAAVLYTTPGGTQTTISAMTVTNTTVDVVTVTIHLAPSAGSPDATNMILSARNLAPGESRIVGEAIGQTLAPGGTIQALASVSTSVNMVASGYETVA